MFSRNDKVKVKGTDIVGFIIRFYGEKIQDSATISTAPFGKGEILGEFWLRELERVKK